MFFPNTLTDVNYITLNVKCISICRNEHYKLINDVLIIVISCYCSSYNANVQNVSVKCYQRKNEKHLGIVECL